MKRYVWLGLTLLTCAFFTGCPQPSESTDGHGAEPAGKNGDDHAHVHEGDDKLVWQRQKLEHEGYLISLGHHGETLFADHNVEPAVMITRDGQDVPDAKVFVALVNGDQVTEQATVFEPNTDEEPAHYAQANLKLPADATEATLRFRIELPGASEFTQEVNVDVETH